AKEEHSTSTSTSPVAGGLCITGLASDSSTSSADRSLPDLSHSSSTSTSAWSSEYYGSSHSGPTLHQPSPPTDAPSSEEQRAPRQESLTRSGHTVAASPSTRLALDCLEDPFSPPSTTYFAFLNRPARPPRGHMHPLDMDTVDPLEMPSNNSRPPRFSPPLSSYALSEQEQIQPHEHHPGQHRSTSPPLLGPFMTTTGRRRSSLIGPFSDVEMPMLFDASGPRGGGDDSNEDELDVVLVEEGREASDSEVMEQSALDFPEGHSIHSRRSSVQFMAPLQGVSSTTSMSITSSASSMHPQRPLSSSSVLESMTMSETFGTIPSVASIASNLSNGTNNGSGNGVASGRFGARRASMPSNRLEM
ncbi:hypothetical protein BGZ94_010223, partial [Podila epigama]